MRRPSTPIIAACIAVFGGALLYPILDHSWLNYDDNLYVTENAHLLEGLSGPGIAWAFTTFHGANWFPLTWLSWLLDYELYGLEAGGFLATNVLLHVISGALLFAALVQLTSAPGRSAFVAAVFIAHPLHLESVAWVAARKDPLSGLFFMLALLLYARAAKPGSPKRRGLLFICLALGLMAKPTLVTFPFLLLLLDFWPLGRLGSERGPGILDPTRVWDQIREKLPLFALVGAFCVVVVIAQRHGGTVVSLDQLSWQARLANAGVAYWGYIEKSFWPAGLAIIYPHPGAELPLWKPLTAAAGLAGLTLAALSNARTRPYLALGWLWFLGTLVPVIGLVQVGSQAMADRYAYLPLIGLSIAVTWGVADLLAPRRLLAGAIAIGVIAALAAGTSVQLKHWRNSEALFEHALSVTEDNHIAHAHLGAALLARGEPALAAAHYRDAIRLRPDFLEVSNNLAWLLATCEDDSVRNPFLALELAKRAVDLAEEGDPNVLDTLAAAYASAGRFGDARRTLEEAIQGIENSENADLTPQLRHRLRLYAAKMPYREAVSRAESGPPDVAPEN